MLNASDAGAAEAQVNQETDQAGPKRSAAAADPRESTKPNTLPPWAVILHNDDINGMDFVIESLLKVFTMNAQQAIKLTLQAHTKGRAVVWSGHRELAELKASQLTGRGADPAMMHRGAKPLRVTVEKMPG